MIDLRPTRITLESGATTNSTKTELIEPNLVIFVGPNNSGKSLLLREIANTFTAGHRAGQKILHELSFPSFDDKQVDELEMFCRNAKPRADLPASYISYDINGHKVETYENSFKQALKNSSDRNQSSNFAAWVLKPNFVNLNGASRIGILDNQKEGDLHNPQSTLGRLFVNDKKRKDLRKIIYDAFSFYLGIDVSQGDKISMRFGGTPPPKNERSLEDAVLSWHKNATISRDASDGVRAFTGILTSLYVGDPQFIAIDEPEAFLAPALANKLGKEIANLAAKENKQIFVSTHSAEFLHGALQSNAKVDIVRLTYEGGIATSRVLPNGELRKMVNDPLLRSADVLSGLFYQGMVVTEADSDRAFYQEINHRLLAIDDPRGVEGIKFVNANGKDQLYRIAQELRKFGIPVAVIADIDVLDLGGAAWTNQLKGYFIPDSLMRSLSELKAAVWSSLKKAGEGKPKINGLSELSSSDRTSAVSLISQLSTFGFFVVPVGEAEQWLSNEEINRSKHKWLHSIFDKLGNDPKDANYICPQSGDVWDFIGELRKWLLLPDRLGMYVPSDHENEERVAV